MAWIVFPSYLIVFLAQLVTDLVVLLSQLKKDLVVFLAQQMMDLLVFLPQLVSKDILYFELGTESAVEHRN